MAVLEFVVPANIRDLEEYQTGQYVVENIYQTKEFPNALKAARQVFRDEGCSFILTNFDVYYSLVKYAKDCSRSILFSAYEDIQRAMRDLPNALKFVLENGEDSLQDEVRDKHRNILKMLIYIYGKLIHTLEEHGSDDQDVSLVGKRRTKKTDNYTSYNCNWSEILVSVSLVLQLDIHQFWNPPVVDELFIKSSLEIVYNFLESESLKTHKDTLDEIWDLGGVIISNFGVDRSFSDRLVRIAKSSESASNMMASGVVRLIKKHNCISLMRDFVHELIDWQMFDKNINANAQRNCQKVIVDLAGLLPEEMFSELEFLSKYLHCNCVHLRISVLSVIAEILLVCRRKPDIKEDIQMAKLEMLNTVLLFTADKVAAVRTRVFQLMANLQKENAIPIMKQNDFLEKAVLHMYDTQPSTRKSVIGCVLSFLACNIYGSTIKLGNLTKECETKEDELNKLKIEYFGIQESDLEEIASTWLEHEKPFRNFIHANMENTESTSEDDDDEEKENVDQESPLQDVDEIVTRLRQVKLSKSTYKEMLRLVKNIIPKVPSLEAMTREAKKEELPDLYMVCIRALNVSLRDKLPLKIPTESQMKDILMKEQEVEYLTSAIRFAKLMDEALTKSHTLLRSTTLSDMQKTCEFILVAHQFDLDGSGEYVIDLFNIMKINDPERHKTVLQTLKSIILSVDSSLCKNRELEIAKRLINLLKVVPYNNWEDFKNVVASWSESGALNNNLLDLLWKIFIRSDGNEPEYNEFDQRHALILLGMAAKNRPLIVKKNFRVIAQICITTKGNENVLLAVEGCKILQMLATNPDLEQKTAGFRLLKTDTIWNDLEALIKHHFLSTNSQVNSLLAAAIALIFILHDSPIGYLTPLLLDLLHMIDFNAISTTMLVRYNVMVGDLAIRMLHFFDESVYKELKRRKLIQQDKKALQNVSVVNQERATAKRKSVKVNEANLDGSMMEGAEAYDEDGEYISNLLDHHLSGDPNILSELYIIILEQCKHLNKYKDPAVQNTAVIALLRGMLFSTTFCQRHINLVFTILAKSNLIVVKTTIIIHIADLLEIAPNIIEPYTGKIYELLNSEELELRKTTLNVLSMLILKDMIRPQEKLSDLAKCLMDDNQEIRVLVQDFFLSLSRKSNNLYNYLPDIFSHLVETLEEEQLHEVMRFLFGQVDKVKHMESLADRFSLKFKTTESNHVATNIVFVLGLLNLNDKALKKFVQNFKCFQHFVLVPDVYAGFKAIIAKCKKSTEMQESCDELENLMNAMFESTSTAPPKAIATMKMPAPRTKKQRGGNANAKSRTRSKRSFSSSSSEDEEEVVRSSHNQSKKIVLSARRNRNRKQKPRNDENFD